MSKPRWVGRLISTEADGSIESGFHHQTFAGHWPP
jgi:hypothetical protein